MLLFQFIWGRGYEFNAFRYIYKKEPEPIINRQIKATFFEYHKGNKKFNITFKGNIYSTFIKDIIYIEILGRIAIVHITKSDYQCYKKVAVGNINPLPPIMGVFVASGKFVIFF